MSVTWARARLAGRTMKTAATISLRNMACPNECDEPIVPVFGGVGEPPGTKVSA
jgi:hypothetical protein